MDQLHFEDQGTGNTPKSSWTWWWWIYIYIYIYIYRKQELKMSQNWDHS